MDGVERVGGGVGDIQRWVMNAVRTRSYGVESVRQIIYSHSETLHVHAIRTECSSD